jgi:hypothetical protein
VAARRLASASKRAAVTANFMRRGKRGNGFRQQELVCLLECIGEGIGGVDHRLNQVRSRKREGTSAHCWTAMMLGSRDQRDRDALVAAEPGATERIVFDLA